MFLDDTNQALKNQQSCLSRTSEVERYAKSSRKITVQVVPSRKAGRHFQYRAGAGKSKRMSV
jgi:hypothetical protein